MKKSDVARLIRDVEASCKEQGVRFTDPRKFVLEIVAASDKPMGAYDILEALGGYIDNPKPPTAYRAIEFLSEQGLIHRIESLNAYIACATDHRHRGSQFLICDSCGKVVEAHLCEVPAGLAEQAKKKGFTLSGWSAELHGHCADCR